MLDIAATEEKPDLADPGAAENAAFYSLVNSVVHDASARLRLASILRTFAESSTIYAAQARRWHPEKRRRADGERVALVEASGAEIAREPSSWRRIAPR